MNKAELVNKENQTTKVRCNFEILNWNSGIKVLAILFKRISEVGSNHLC